MKKLLLVLSMWLSLGISSVVALDADQEWADYQANKVLKVFWEYDQSMTKQIFTDMPLDPVSKIAIYKLYDWWIVKWSNWKVLPWSNLTRYEFSLIIYRLINKFNLINSPIVWKNKPTFTDWVKDEEFNAAQKLLYDNGIMKWYKKNKKDYFGTHDNLNGEAALAVIGRLCFWLKDATNWNWYETYVTEFQNKKYIPKDWAYIWQPITREEVFKLAVYCVK